ncbi:MAG: xanthine dehydrogenase family protein molybdopterin-binding subunit [Deltaproteobacteria bacterium]|nr:xanthine dehydrogenase family protein molybdopterin-binding subunit [Deltaproteobacteria bacterium]
MADMQNVGQYRVIGVPVERVDGVEMVSGKALYGVDVRLPGMLWGKVLRSPIAHGRVLRIDTEKAGKHPGVRAVITAKDVPQRRYGLAVKDEPMFALDKVCYIGDAVAAVAAVDERTAEEALDLIEVDYEELPGVFEVEEAMRDGAPLVHEQMESYGVGKGYQNAWKPVPGTNVVHRAVHERGDVKAGFQLSDYVFEDNFRASQIHHCYMEPHAVVAESRIGSVTVWSCTQEVFPVRTLLAELFGLPESKVRVICTKVGGGFGGKIQARLEPYAVALSLKTGKPVKMVMTRSEEFTSAAGSTPPLVRVRTGVMKDGTLVAREVDYVWNTGAYAEGLAPCNRAIKDGTGPYRVPHVRVTSTLVYTNKVRGTQLRGLGVPEGIFAIESQMDMIAKRLGIDPLELRMKNLLDEGDTNSMGDVVYSIGLKECLRRAAEAIGWGEPKQENIGRGLAVVAKSPTTQASISGAYVQLNEDGSAQVLVGASEIGQGAVVVLSQIAAEELGLPIDAVGITVADTAVTPYDRGTYSSRVTLYAGNAVKNAAADARKQLLEVASKMTEIPESELKVENQRIVARNQPGLSLTFREVVQSAHIREKPILGRGWAGGKGDYPIGTRLQAKALVPGWKYGAQAVEVEVDKETGMVRVRKIVSAHDMGTALNPLLVKGQIVGAAVMGLGYALHERLIFDEGRVTNPSFMDYKIPSSPEIPEVVPIFVEVPLPEGPFGAKGVGELSIVGIAPAVGNAIYDAIKVRMKELPMNAERVLAEIEGQTAAEN